jgi:hypothetical protein
MTVRTKCASCGRQFSSKVDAPESSIRLLESTTAGEESKYILKCPHCGANNTVHVPRGGR